MPVYMIQAGGPAGPVKIGYGDPQSRLVGCQVGNHLELNIIRQFEGSVIEEMALHSRFEDLWIRGEWHNFSRAMLGDVGLVEIDQTPPQCQPKTEARPAPASIQVETGRRLELARKNAGLTQTDVARIAGVSKAAVSMWENASTRIRVDRVSVIARALNVSTDWLFSTLPAEDHPNV